MPCKTDVVVAQVGLDEKGAIVLREKSLAAGLPNGL
jgi:hypothetical protein